MRITVRITRSGAVGKYTRVSVIKRRKAKWANYERKDQCVIGRNIVRCPDTE